MKIVSTGYADAKRIEDDEGEPLAMAMRYTGGLWAVHALNTDVQLCRPIHKTPKAAMNWFSKSEAEMAAPSPEM